MHKVSQVGPDSCGRQQWKGIER